MKMDGRSFLKSQRKLRYAAALTNWHISQNDMFYYYTIKLLNQQFSYIKLVTSVKHLPQQPSCADAAGLFYEEKSNK